MSNFPFKNGLIKALMPPDREDFGPRLTFAELALEACLENPGEEIERVYFPEGGLLSVVLEDGGKQIDVALVGYEGMSGAAVVLSDSISPYRTVVKVTGVAHWISSIELRKLLSTRPTIRSVIDRYLHVISLQVSQTAAANGRARLDTRLARWLLMSEDRVGPDFPITHNSLARMLGVRRPGITDALHRLEGQKYIRSIRGVVLVLDRQGLKGVAGSMYGSPEREYARLLPGAVTD